MNWAELSRFFVRRNLGVTDIQETMRRYCKHSQLRTATIFVRTLAFVLHLISLLWLDTRIYSFRIVETRRIEKAVEQTEAHITHVIRMAAFASSGKKLVYWILISNLQSIIFN